MKVAIYLRVSTLEQANRGNTNRDGFSIPAQREACRRKAKSLKATVVKEYLDRGESARSADRPGLQSLLGDLCEQKNFEYVIVHKIDRLARNLHDDVVIGLAIKKGGAKLVSVTENIDETPSGRLLHGIMATIAEFYSRNLAAEALKGATEKAKQGGTPYQAPIGYINVTERQNRREIHTIAVDPSRAPLIRWAFERYATGEYSQRRIQEELAIRGLKSRLNGRSNGEPLSKSGVNSLLSNRYYLGYVSYCGVEYKGRHQPLITPAVFNAVQAIRESRSVIEKKYREHYHYLSRLLLCGKCGRHLCYELSKRQYEYFSCVNRRYKTCNQAYIPANLAEDAVQTYMNQIVLTVEERQKLATQISKELLVETRFAENELKQQKQRQNHLLSEQDNLLQAYYEKILSSALFQREQKRITKEIRQTNLLTKETEIRLEIIQSRRDKALDIAKNLNVGQVYKNSKPVIRRHLFLAFFTKLAIDDSAPVFQKLGFGPGEHHIFVNEAKIRDTLNIRQITEAVILIAMK